MQSDHFPPKMYNIPISLGILLSQVYDTAIKHTVSTIKLIVVTVTCISKKFISLLLLVYN